MANIWRQNHNKTNIIINVTKADHYRKFISFFLMLTVIREVYSIQQYVIKLLSDLRQVGRRFSPSSPVSSTNKTDRHDIADTLPRTI
jgi:hypothetical protein